MPLATEEIKHLASLARLDVTAEEAERYGRELASILEYVAKLQGVSEPAGGDARPPVTLRADEVQPWPNPQELIAQAPDHVQNFVVVPPVFQDRE